MNLTTSGVHYFEIPQRPGRRVLLDLAGTTGQFNGLTATIGYQAADGEFSPCLQSDGSPVEITSRGGFELRVPRSGLVGVSLSAAPAAGGLTLDCIAAIDMPPGS
jgi:hypothetical protein